MGEKYSKMSNFQPKACPYITTLFTEIQNSLQFRPNPGKQHFFHRRGLNPQGSDPTKLQLQAIAGKNEVLCGLWPLRAKTVSRCLIAVEIAIYFNSQVKF